MATSIADLLDDLQGLTRHVEQVDADTAGQAITSLGHLGRGLALLADADDIPRPIPTERSLVLRDVASTCIRAAGQWPRMDGRLPELAAVAADVVGRRAPRLDASEQSLLVGELNQVARDCLGIAKRFPPYAQILILTRAERAATRCAQVVRPQHAAARAGMILDEPVPATRIGTEASPARRMSNSIAGLAHAVQADARDGTLSVYAVLAAAAAAETASTRADAVAEQLNGGRPVRRSAAPQAWRVVQAALLNFDDGSRYSKAPPSVVVDWAVRLQESVDALPNRATSLAEVHEGATAARAVANQLPALADQIAGAVQRWATGGRLYARARSLPPSERHVPEMLHNRVVIATPEDVAPVARAARVAGRLSTALAVELDRTAGRIGRQPQRHLAAALATGLNADRLAHDAQWAERLAARCQPRPPAAPTLVR